MTAIESQEDELGEELADTVAQVAQALAAVSALPALQGIVDRDPAPRTVEELAVVGSSSWLGVVIREQDWLYLDNPIPPELYEHDAMAAARALFAGIGVSAGRVAACVRAGEFGPALTRDGAIELLDRLDSALRCAERCTAAASSGGDFELEEIWDQCWSEELGGDLAFDRPIEATSEAVSICDLVALATDGQLILNPTYQRDDVWKVGDASQLIESILQGIPLPSIVLLEVPSRGRSRLPRYEVVDGKQRITAILRFIGEHPKAIDKAKSLDSEYGNVGFEAALEDDHREFFRLWKRYVPQKLTADVRQEFMLPFPLDKRLQKVAELTDCSGKYFTEIRTKILPSGINVKKVFRNVAPYKLLWIKFSNTEPRQIHKVFELYNRQGKHLNAEEIRNAVFHDLPLMRAVLGAGQLRPDVAKLLSDSDGGSRQLRETVVRIAGRLDETSVPSDRYRRTKLFAWVLAAVFALRQNEGRLVVRSTATQINEMLEQIRKDQSGGDCWQSLAATQPRGLERLFDALDDAIQVLDEVELFDGTFKTGGKGRRWQDLQFVSALGALLIARLTLEGAFKERIEARAEAVYLVSTTLRRPKKSQNVTQWRFIGRSICEFLRALDVQPSDVTAAFQSNFRHDPMPALSAASEQADHG
jgi:hypothetical protein